MADRPIAMKVPLLAPAHAHASAWWAMVTLIATEATLFAYLLFSYYYIAVQTPKRWPPGGPLDITISLINTLILLASSATMVKADRHHEKRRARAFWMVVTICLGVVFVIVQGTEWTDKSFTLSSHAFGSLYYVITGFHLAHVIVGLLMLGAVLFWVWTVDDQKHSFRVRLASYYWHFVDAVWLLVFFSFFIFPRLL